MIFETVALPSVGTLSKLANTCSISTGMDEFFYIMTFKILWFNSNIEIIFGLVMQ
jgi:hypothetical protein